MAGALEGVRIIDFGQYLAGPMAALFFADQGADVIRIDPPQGPRWRHHANAILQQNGFHGVMRLDEVRQVDRIPTLGTGKTDYKVLRSQIQEELQSRHEAAKR